MNALLPQEQKLNVIFRVESGCLGPAGHELIDRFCQFAQDKFENIDSEFLNWSIVPRHDKKLPEIQYQVNNKNLTSTQASQYLERFSKDRSELEDFLHDEILNVIEEFMHSVS